MQQVENRSLLYFGANGVSDSVLGSIRSAGWDVAVASAPEQACRMINEQHIHVGLAQVDTTDAELLLPIEELMHRSGRIEWIGLFEPSALQKSSIKKMIGESFYDFHTLPPDPPRLLTALGHAYGMAHMKWEEGDVLDRSQSEEEEMVGTSPLLQNLFQGIRKVAGVAAPLLITGESGTGKELAAKAVHERSMFRNGPFVAVNCGAMPGSLVQSELFGYEKGAFTGAQQR
ncbi:MAG TPA: sigma 54-interacting transcriptional regulator, partial [Methylophilaceae bacterium]|nr:sigma 54-interacting transcriptional regulator [Methylophilaceae bacterium]